MVITGEDDYTQGLVPQETQRSIASSIQMIASTPYGTVPYARELGLKTLFPKDNSEMRRNEYAADLADAIERWEGRISVKEIGFTNEGEAKVVIAYDE